MCSPKAAALTPAAEAAKPFAEEYKVFAAAVDTTRHELPLKNLHTEEDRGRFLGLYKVALSTPLNKNIKYCASFRISSSALDVIDQKIIVNYCLSTSHLTFT